MAKKETLIEETDRKVYRHKRRIRNQIISYIVLAVFLTGLIIGGAVGIKKIISIINDKKETKEKQKQLEELQGTEDEQPIVEAPEESAEPEQESDYLEQAVDDCISQMSLEDKVAGLFMITPEVLTDTDTVLRAGDTTEEKLGERPVGGLIYFSKNIQSA